MAKSFEEKTRERLKQVRQADVWNRDYKLYPMNSANEDAEFYERAYVPYKQAAHKENVLKRRAAVQAKRAENKKKEEEKKKKLNLPKGRYTNADKLLNMK